LHAYWGNTRLPPDPSRPRIERGFCLYAASGSSATLSGTWEGFWEPWH
jgi:hypothetical protein